MTRALSFAALAGLVSLLAACGGSDDDARVISPEAEPSQPAATRQADAAASRTAFVKPEDPARPALSGQQIFNAQCVHCHGAGEEHPGTFQLAATRGAGYAVLEQREDLTSDYVKYIVRNGLNGMPPFKPTVITDAELDMLAGYLAKAD
ncbi:c-type cytochrome [Hyphococcus sp.]|jgi:mono/diheme cytochrome c family protein|uniref:c-type cytochrome n=1 Tax=Hyphococcus sp. TaxID=2038636 RepID=UPI003D0D57FA